MTVLSTMVLLALCVAPRAQAATITVTTTDDELNADGDCSLREAIQAANLDTAVSGCAAGAGADTIELPAGTYLLSRVGAGEDGNATGDLDVMTDITFQGQGSAVTIIDGGGIDRVLHVVFGAVELRDLAITGGSAPAPAFTGLGGGIYNELGALTLVNTRVVGNTSQDNAAAAVTGIGIHNATGRLVITNSQIINNTPGVNLDSHGGGLYVDQGEVQITDSLIAGNRVKGTGGGLYIGGNLGFTLVLQRSTVSNNAAYDGGGLYLGDRYLEIVNSTVSGNAAERRGGGMFIDQGGVSVNNATIANNTADANINGDGDGGGLWLNPGLAENEFRNVLVADNVDSGGEAPDCIGGLISAGYNLIENVAGCVITGDLTGNITGLDPQLAALADNGGLTQTHGIPMTSAAFDAGSCTDTDGAAVTEDQRSEARPQFSTCDIGAFELQATILVDLTPLGPGDPNCPLGGVRIDSGPDLNFDGVLDPGEITDTTYVCSGFNSLVRITALPVGDPSCPSGGQQIDTGLDNGDGAGTAADGILHDDEVDQTTYVCNGAGGGTGVGTLIRVTTLAAGNANCANGGQQIDVGLDNGDGGGVAGDLLLQNGEVDETVYVCNGTNGTNGHDSLVRITALSVGDANCANGGQQVDSGLDNGDGTGTADDGVLHDDEVDATAYVCNGSGGPGGYDSLLRLTALSVGDANCANGGQRVDSGLDNGDGTGTASDGVLDDDEVDATAYVCGGGSGTDGFDSLIRLTALPVGDANCALGGQRVDTGLDNGDGAGTADDGVLHADEVDATAYVCNGGSGSAGFSSLVRLTTLPVGDANCAYGGQRVDTGLDNGDGAGTAGDGVLHADEVDSSAYVCEGGRGLTGLVSQTDEPAGTNCANGGTRIETGLDDDGDGTLDPGEVDQTTYLCNTGGGNGQDGHDALTSVTDLPIGDSDCPDGGKRIDMGTDSDDDLILDASEITGTINVCSTGSATPMVEGGGCSQGGSPPGLPLAFLLMAFGWLWIRRTRR